jgi:hypothetical protein
LFLYYYLTLQFSLGVGGRYWAAWSTNGALPRAAVAVIERPELFLGVKIQGRRQPVPR